VVPDEPAVDQTPVVVVVGKPKFRVEVSGDFSTETLAAVLAMPRAPLNRELGKHGKHRANTAHPFPDIPAHRWPAMVATAPARDR
jgi:hypothetical protein